MTMLNEIPPWERKAMTPLEGCIELAYFDDADDDARAAWKRLLALERVAEAVNEWVVAANAPSDDEMSDVSDAWEEIALALAELKVTEV